MPDAPPAPNPDPSRATLAIAFAGSPVFAARILARLARLPFCPKLVLTQPDRPKGRGRKLVANAVKQLAIELDLELEQPRTLKKSASIVEQLQAFDVFVVAAYGLILPQPVLDAPRFGCINVHASLLPRWRGAAPVERAMIAGDAQTGVSIMHMLAGLDTGPVYDARATPIRADDTAGAVEDRLAVIGADLLVEVLGAIESAKAGTTPLPVAIPQQDTLATYADKLSPADRAVDWTLSAKEVARRVMALADRLPVTVASGELRIQLLRANPVASERAGEPGTITRTDKSGIYVGCATGELQITALRLNRGKGTVLDAASALNGYASAFATGTAFAGVI